MKWSDLTMRERSDLMSLFLKHGIGSLSDMRNIYDGLHDNPQEDNWLVRARKNVTDFLGITDHYTDYKRNKRIADAVIRKYELANDPPGPAHRLPDGTISYGEEPLINVDGALAAAIVPALGIGETSLNIVRGIVAKDPAYIAASIMGEIIPGKVNRALKKAMNTPEFNYRVKEYSRNRQLQELMNYGPNSGILVHGDPSGIGVTKVGQAIGNSDGKITSFPHFENGNLVPGKGGNLRIHTGQGIFVDMPEKERVIFWGDGIPFYETRVGNTMLFDDDRYARYLSTQRAKYAKSRPNEFILDSPYRYIATERASATTPVTTRTEAARGMSEIQTKEVPIDKLWGIEWDPLIGTWGKTIYSPKEYLESMGEFYLNIQMVENLNQPL